MREFKLAIFLGRFQPFHSSHAHVIKKALEQADKVLIILGSANAAASIKNPFSVSERRSMIQAGLSPEERIRVNFDSVRDYYYSDNLWVSNVQSIAQQAMIDYDCEDSDVTLISNYKDASSYYLDLFPQWHKMVLWGDRMDATEVRKVMFNRNCGTEDFKKFLPEGTHKWLCDNFIGTEKHAQLIREMEFIDNYKRSWSSAPFPVTFVTTDTVVVKSGHVLMVTRKFEPGKGLLALPGGFIKQNERILDGAIRELKEETRIDIPVAALRERIKSKEIFDHPDRSSRGRTITIAYLIDLGKGDLPKIKANDDAESVAWVPLADLYQHPDRIFEDHLAIIMNFVSSIK